ncbi:MAG: dihydroorotase [Candidatus Scalindua rubra]|uniref:Dihydroorotase n=1 Tax=Candidatus Scalindua rubra TaxID=1872076 RepID=A0A1E3X5G3_9BACT|nr:MAG: dihydroorotase [Candidatus Scalindua rubra]
MLKKKNILLKNGRVIDPINGIDSISDVLIIDGMISMLSQSIKPEYEDIEVVDVSRKIVVPGLIECHVHLREPGYEDKETIETGSRSAAKGGFTTIICEPNTNPPIDEIEAVENLMGRIKDKALVNIYTKACITKSSKGEALTDIEKLGGHSGVVAFSDDGNPVLKKGLMEKGLSLAELNKKPLSPHCEDSASLSVKDFSEAELGFSPGKIFENEANFISRDIGYARSTGCHVHFSHVSLRESIDHIRKWKGVVNITCETTPHHLLLDRSYRDISGEVPNVNPPLRSQDDVESIKKGLCEGVIDVIASDHAPHTVDDKKAGAPGVIGMETTLGLIFNELVRPGIISLKDAIIKMSTNPAKIFKIPGGSLLPGTSADVTIIDMDKEWEVDVNNFESKSRNSPFQGWKLKGQAVMTIVAGKIVMKDGVVIRHR